MNKIMIALAAVATAVVAQAASINWSAMNISSGDGVSWSGGVASSRANGYAAYLFITASTQSSDTIVSYDSVIAAIRGGNMSILDSAAKKVATNAMGMVPTTAVGSYGVTQADTVSGFMVVFDNASADDAGFFAVSDVKTAEFAQATSVNSPMSWTGFTANNAWQEIASVPEPTSGLLLLLGVAGLALRRKQA